MSQTVNHTSHTTTDLPLFAPTTLEEAEFQLQRLEEELQQTLWNSDEQEKRALLYKTLCQQSHIINACKRKELDARHQKELLNTVVRTAEEERERIAQTLHDDLGLLITSIKLRLAHFVDQENISPGQKESLRANLASLDELASSIRNLTEALNASSLKYLGLGKTLKAWASKLSHANLIVETTLPEAFPIKTEHLIHLYRIVQEILNNIMKHTEATRITITGAETGDPLLRITYNSVGLTTEEAARTASTTAGCGLRNIQSRAQLINAVVEYTVTGHMCSEVLISMPQAKSDVHEE